MTPVFLISSALEIFWVLVAGAIFLTIVIAAVAAAIWFVTGLLRQCLVEAARRSARASRGRSRTL